MDRYNQGCILLVTGIDNYFKRLPLPTSLKNEIQNSFYQELMQQINKKFYGYVSKESGDDGFALIYANHQTTLVVYSDKYTYQYLSKFIQDNEVDNVVILRQPAGRPKDEIDLLKYRAQERNMSIIEQSVPKIIRHQLPHNILIANNSTDNNDGNLHIGDIDIAGNVYGGKSPEEPNNKKWYSPLVSFLVNMLGSILANIITGACPFLQNFC